MITKNKKPQNPNAFPSSKTDYVDVGHTELKSVVHYQGMTLRDYFAAKAIVNLSGPSFYQGEKETEESLKAFAKRAYQVADALLKERENV